MKVLEIGLGGLLSSYMVGVIQLFATIHVKSSRGISVTIVNLVCVWTDEVGIL